MQLQKSFRTRARPLRGGDVLDRGLQTIASATTIEQAQKAQAIGLSKGWMCRLRNQFIADDTVDVKDKSVRGGRRSEHLTSEREAKLLKPARIGGVLMVNQIKLQLEVALGRKMTLSSVCKLLHRHNWGKHTLDKRHPQSDPVS